MEELGDAIAYFLVDVLCKNSRLPSIFGLCDSCLSKRQLSSNLSQPTSNRIQGCRMSREEHPVWSVYDRLRSARLSVKYYSKKLQQTEKLNFWLEVVLLIAAPSSAVAGLWFWESEYGQIIWKFLAIPAAIVAVLKPQLHLTKKIKDYEGVLSGYRILEYDLMEIKIGIEQKKKYDAPLQADFKRAQQRERTLVGKNPESCEDTRVKKLCQAEVASELPANTFFVPEE